MSFRIVDVFTADSKYSTYAADPVFQSLIEEVGVLFPTELTNALPEDRLKAATESALMTVAARATSPEVKSLALKIIHETFNAQFNLTDVPPGLPSEWFVRATNGTAGVNKAQPDLGLISAEKISAKEAFGVYLGIQGIGFSDLGTVPGGGVGARIVALRFIIANGEIWNERYVWKGPLEKKGATSDQLEKIEILLAEISRLKQEIAGMEPHTKKSLVDDLLFDVGMTEESLLKVLVILNEDLGLAQYARERIATVPSDKLYLSTYDLNNYPATTVTQGQLKYVIVADKGEMGTRIMREALAKGVTPVVLYNINDDSNALQVREAKAAGGFVIGLDGDFKATYANPSQIVEKVHAFFKEQFGDNASQELARAALHPGYGPLAENSMAIQMFRRNGIVFMGPMQDVVDRGGDKRRFRSIAERQDPTAVTPGITIESSNPAEIYEQVMEAYRNGRFIFPGRIKAANGGGGRGQVVVEVVDKLRSAIDEVSRDIEANGWSPGVMFEQNIPETVHLEVQVLRDRYGNTRIFGMRDCTEQRNSQKIQEEAPPALLKKYPGLQEQIQRLSRQIADELGYVGAGTIELMFKDGKFYFLEMNTRIQVEHPVTEETQAIRQPDGSLKQVNLVQLQMDIANGGVLSFSQDDIVANRVGREFRINSEKWDARRKNPKDGGIGLFAPNAGIIDEIKVPSQTEVLAMLAEKGIVGIKDIVVRMDSGFEAGDVLVNKDPTFAKLIIAIETEDEFKDQEYELLRLASIEVLKHMKIEGRQVMPNGNVAMRDGAPMPFETNIADHIRVLNSRRLKLHSQGVHQGRHVNWVVAAFRDGENLDSSSYPPLVKSTNEETDTSLVYIFHRNDSSSYVVPPMQVLTNPDSYKGLIANYLTQEKSRKGDLNIERIFGMPIDREKHRASVSISPDGNITNMILFENDRPIRALVSTELEGKNTLLMVGVEYKHDLVVLTITDLTRNKTIHDSIKLVNGVFPPTKINIPDVGMYEFGLYKAGKRHFFGIRNEQGDYLLRVYPHLAKDMAERYIDLLATSRDSGLSEKQRQQNKEQARAIFIQMALTTSDGTTTRDEFIKKVSGSHETITNELFYMLHYKNGGDAVIEKAVHDFAREALAYRYYNTRYHHVTRYEAMAVEGTPVAYAEFNDDRESLIPHPSEDDRSVVWVEAEGSSDWAQSLKKALSTGLKALEQNKLNEHSVVEVMMFKPDLSDDEFASQASAIINRTLNGTLLRRVTVSTLPWKQNGDSSNGSRFFTFRPTNSVYAESLYHPEQGVYVPRGVHPMVAEQLEYWRWTSFDIEPITNTTHGISAIEVKSCDSKAADKRLVLSSQIRKDLQPLIVGGNLLGIYLNRVVDNKDAGEVLSKIGGPIVPVNLNERLDAFVISRFKKENILPAGFRGNLEEALKIVASSLSAGTTLKGFLSSFAHQVGDALLFVPEIEEAVNQEIAELKQLIATRESKTTLNRLQVYLQQRTHVTPEAMKAYLEFYAQALRDTVKDLKLDRINITFTHQPSAADVSRTYVALVSMQPDNFGEVNVIEPLNTDLKVEPKSSYDMTVQKLHETGNLAPLEKAQALFDGSNFEELRFVDSTGKFVMPKSVADLQQTRSMAIAPVDENYLPTVRAFVGLIGGQRTMVVSVSPNGLGARPGLSFDEPDGSIIERYLDYAITEGMGVIKLEELSSGANLWARKDKEWGAARPLDSFGREFRPRYQLKNKPNLTLIFDMVVGGGIYGPMGSHDRIALRGQSVAALTGGGAAAFAGVARPLIENGRIKASGQLFFERSEGSTEVHNANGVFTAVASTDDVDALLADLPSWETALADKRESLKQEWKRKIEAVPGQLSAEQKIALQRAGLDLARRRFMMLANSPESLVSESADLRLDRPVSAFTDWLNDEAHSAIRTDQKRLIKLATERSNGRTAFLPFTPVLEGMALKDSHGKPLVEFWGGNWALDMLTGFMVIPVKQADGSIKPQSVAFMMNNPTGPSRGAIDTAASLKSAEFLKICKELGLDMVRFAGSPGFKANAAEEAKGIELLGSLAMEEVINYNENGGVIYVVEIDEDDGGARIFMASQTLGKYGHIVTDAVDLGADSRIRVAALPTMATAPIIASKDLLAVADDAARYERQKELAGEARKSGTVQMAQKEGAIRDVFASENILSQISSGLRQAHDQTDFARLTFARLDTLKIHYVPEQRSPGLTGIIFHVGGKEFNGQSLMRRLDDIERLSAYAKALDLDFEMKPDLTTIIGGVEALTLEEYISETQPGLGELIRLDPYRAASELTGALRAHADSSGNAVGVSQFVDHLTTGARSLVLPARTKGEGSSGSGSSGEPKGQLTVHTRTEAVRESQVVADQIVSDAVLVDDGALAVEVMPDIAAEDSFEEVVGDEVDEIVAANDNSAYPGASILAGAAAVMNPLGVLGLGNITAANNFAGYGVR